MIFPSFRTRNFLLNGCVEGPYRVAQYKEDAVRKILIASTFALALAGCGSTQGDRALGGAALGGATGAVVGGLATGTGGGALAGAAVGAAGGAIIGGATAPRSRYSRCYIDDYGREICRR
jgi:hypothetical protein